MPTDYSWQESYMKAFLESDWTKMEEKIQAAESEIRERQRLFAEDHGGTAEERQAIADAINGLRVLRSEARQERKRSDELDGLC